MPHQFEKLVELSGSKEIFAKKLKYGFDNNLIDYGNEPAFLAVQAFHYAGRSDLASFYVRKLMRERFDEKGYSGNDDSGAMSSWYMFSAMGFFPNAGQDIYFVDFVANNVTFADLGPGWTIDDENRELYPGEDFNLLIINIDKETGKITSKIASNGLVSGPPGMLPDCGK